MSGATSNRFSIMAGEEPCEHDLANEEALRLVVEHRALVKTVRDGDWLRLLHNFARQDRFRTSFTLLPPSGRMHLYGGASSQGAGLLFDRCEVDLNDALCWPSGYFAKTEHHLSLDADGKVTLTGGRSGRLVSLEQLIASNLEADGEASPTSVTCPLSPPYPVCLLDQHQGTTNPDEASTRSDEDAVASGEAARSSDGAAPPLYNEVALRATGVRGLRAVFVRASVDKLSGDRP
jgi:hypothetical protein